MKARPKRRFIKLDELAERWQRAPITMSRLARKLGLSIYRINTKSHLYDLDEVEAIEEAARVRPPFSNGSVYGKREVTE